MKTLIAISLLLSTQLCHADEDAIKTANTHLSNLLKSDFEKLSETYTARIELMAGHEFLKDSHGIAEAGSRAKGAEVERGKLITAMKKATAERPARPAEQIAKMLEMLKFEPIETKEGDFAVAPADPVGTADGKLHFTIKKGDILVKVAPPKGDFLILHLRKIETAWKVVSEYID